MTTLTRAFRIAPALAVLAFAANADSLRCHGSIIDPGVTEQELLKKCGEPAAVEGADWLYEFPGSEPMLVTLGNGVVMFIRGLDESDAGFGTHPLGDRP